MIIIASADTSYKKVIRCDIVSSAITGNCSWTFIQILLELIITILLFSEGYALLLYHTYGMLFCGWRHSRNVNVDVIGNLNYYYMGKSSYRVLDEGLGGDGRGGQLLDTIYQKPNISPDKSRNTT